jgi:hypothetical protein
VRELYQGGMTIAAQIARELDVSSSYAQRTLRQVKADLARQATTAGNGRATTTDERPDQTSGERDDQQPARSHDDQATTTERDDQATTRATRDGNGRTTTTEPYRWVQGREVGTSLGLVPEGLRELLIPSPRSTREPAPVVRQAAPGHPYGLAALQGECAELAATPKGEHNRQLWESARNLYNLVAGGVLSEVQVDHAIRHAAAQCGLLEQEPRQTEATLASAREVGLAHPRGIPDHARTAADASHHQPPQPAPKRTPER